LLTKDASVTGSVLVKKKGIFYLNIISLLLTTTSEKDTFNYHNNTALSSKSYKKGGCYVKMQR